MLSEIIVKRLKPILCDKISPMQASYILGTKIHDNIIVVKEIMHTIKKARRKNAFMAIKIDLEMTYDYLNWNFIQHTLKEFMLSPI